MKKPTGFKVFCVARGYTAQEVSDMVLAKTGVEMPKATVYSYMQGARFPSKANMEALAEALGEDVITSFYK